MLKIYEKTLKIKDFQHQTTILLSGKIPNETIDKKGEEN